MGAVSCFRNIEAYGKNQLGSCRRERNPADIGSRGATASFLADSKLCWEGPEHPYHV